ncbi:MAG: histidinol-phosphate transaminase [Oscillospiraceae bacterium]|nr:histidinol-phosphate transaminase [Oscillospiraceae bacterium]
MTQYIPENIRSMEEYKPNSGVFRIRLDANESPFPLSGGLKKKIESAVGGIMFNRYPDPGSEALISAFADRFNVDKSLVTAGNGSDELISLVFQSFTKYDDAVLTAMPDFSMYSFYPEVLGRRVIRYEKKYDRIDYDELYGLIRRENIKLIMFSNPCNPTGQLENAGEIAALASECGCIVVCDEAYMEFSSKNESLLDRVSKFDNLIVLKTMSKAFGIASLRVGFAVTNKLFADTLKKIKSPYNVNSLSQEIARIILTDGYGELKAGYMAISKEKFLLSSEIEKLCPALDANQLKTETNFVVIDTPRAAKIFNGLADAGIAVRYFGGDSPRLRITCGSPEENRELLSALRKIGLNNNERTGSKK